MNDHSNTTSQIVEKWDNVVPFKRPEKKLKEEINLEEMAKDNDKNDKLRRKLDQMVEHHSSEFFEGLHIAGIEFDESNHDALNDFFFITESIRSALYRLHGIYHEIQDVVDEDFAIDDATLEQAIKFVDAPVLTQEQLEELLKLTSENPDIETDIPD